MDDADARDRMPTREIGPLEGGSDIHSRAMADVPAAASVAGFSRVAYRPPHAARRLRAGDASRPFVDTK